MKIKVSELEVFEKSFTENGRVVEYIDVFVMVSGIRVPLKPKDTTARGILLSAAKATV
jgi:hypothetical protein